MQLAIYIGHNTDTKLLNKINDFYSDDECFLVTNEQPTDKDLQVKEFAVINFYHVYHYTGKIVFLSYEDFNKRASGLIAKKIVVTTKKDMVKLDKSLMKNVDVLILDNNNTIRKAKNAELQSVLR